MRRGPWSPRCTERSPATCCCAPAGGAEPVRLPPSAHEGHDWVIGRIAPDFDLLDVWALPVEGGLEDFDEAVEVLTAMEPGRSGSRVSRFLFAVRYRLGDLLGWDR